jgi:hypothetical protein
MPEALSGDVVACACDIARVTGVSPESACRVLADGLVPLLALAARHPGELLPSPSVSEAMHMVKLFGSGLLREQTTAVSLAEPVDDASALRAYRYTLETLRGSGHALHEAVWPEITTFADAGGYKG